MELTPTTRAGEHWRVVDPDWVNPLDATFSRAPGGRWNPPGSYGALYLNSTVQLARAQVEHRFAGRPIGVLMLRPERRPQLAVVDVAQVRVQDCVSADGLARAGLTATYPRRDDGSIVAHEDCWPLADAAQSAGLSGVACRSAAAPDSPDEELALFEQSAVAAATLTNRLDFDDWYVAPRGP